MFDIILLCLITGFIIYKLYTKFGMYNNNDVEVRNRIFDTKKAQAKKQTQTLEGRMLDGNASMSAEILNVNEKKDDFTFDKQKIAQEQIKENNKKIDELSSLLSEDAKKNLVDFYSKYPRFNFDMMQAFAKDFFELFFECYYENKLEKLNKFVTSELLASFSKSIEQETERSIDKTQGGEEDKNEIKHINLLYKIESITIYDVIYTKAAITICFNVAALKISYNQDSKENLLSGSKKNPLRFENKLTFTKTFKDHKDEQFDWMLSSIA